MKISLIQYAIEWLNPEKNWTQAEKWIAASASTQASVSALAQDSALAQKPTSAQVVVLPEMFATGFCMTPQKSAPSAPESLRWMKQMAAKYNVTLCGSLSVEDEYLYYNRLYVVKPDGNTTHYDKRHLFTYAGEDKRYTAGGERTIIEIDGVRILLLVCYDLRFPVWIRNRSDYDVILCVANWPEPRRLAWDTLLRARAIENICYVCGVNIVGEDPTVRYSGGTVAIDFSGATLASVEDNTCGVASVEIDLEALRKWRDGFPALNDGDEFTIKQK